MSRFASLCLTAHMSMARSQDAFTFNKLLNLQSRQNYNGLMATAQAFVAGHKSKGKPLGDKRSNFDFISTSNKDAKKGGEKKEKGKGNYCRKFGHIYECRKGLGKRRRCRCGSD